MFDEKFWLAIAFVSFFILLIKYAGPALLAMIDGKSKQIADEILAAKEMKEKAAKLLVEAEKFYQESIFYTEKLIKDSEEEAKKLTESVKKMTESEISKKTAAALSRIKTEEESAIREVKTFIVTSAVKNLNDLLSQGSVKQNPRLIDRAVDDLEKIIH